MVAGIIFVRTGWPLDESTMVVSVADEGEYS